jgi:DNA-binding transcriptional ArsR family regulator
MAGLLPSSPDIDPNEEPRVVGLDSADADELIEALSSSTTREVLAALHEEPGSASALADRVDTSLQNAQYHLGKLEDAGLVEVGDTVYSEKGREMDIYVPADGALVVVAGREEETAGLKTALSRLLGGIGVLGVASVVVDRLARGGIRFPVGATGSGGGGDSGDGGAERTDGADGAGGGVETREPDVSGAGAGNETTPAEATTGTDADGFSVAEETATPDVATGTEAPSATEAATGTPTPAATGLPTETETPAATRLPTETVTPAPEPLTETATPRPTAMPTEAVETAAAATQPGLFDGIAASPGLVFFLGGATVLVGGFALWWLQQ